MKQREYSEEEIRVMVVELALKLGGVRALSRELAVSPSYVCDVMKGRRAPGPDFLKAVGIRKEVVARYVKDSPAKGRTEDRK